jgi:hypothetical protein
LEPLLALYAPLNDVPNFSCVIFRFAYKGDARESLTRVWAALLLVHRSLHPFEGAFFFGVKVRYLVGKVLRGIESLSQLW